MLAFVTVGSTRFDSLVQAVLSQPVLSTLRLKGYTRLVVQCGNSSFELASSISGEKTLVVEREGVDIELWNFKPTLQKEYESADLVISHAGSGTILDVLRLGKPLIVVVNPTLLDNHQQELAAALADLGHLQHSTIPDLAQTIQSFEPSSLTPFPPFDGSRFAKLLDEHMGFS
ncbi:putative glycosyltransferase family 28 C-terminal domain [Lyophyllum shimeji]|uniref:UDP-N-acetylglucosamine transferase subunit ALG13 n=1 Tax=Lyophyllum shimeji TaxID=47721 RepID=A0A9P3PH89_LYOSH|nr:putative glycosyltransferase family 28 C-terminal domain [Lyophyllum shimeji]